MRIDICHHYDNNPAQVHAMLADPAFWQYTLEGQTQSIEVTPTDGGVALSLGVKAPSQIRAITGETLKFSLQATWQLGADGAWKGPIMIDAGKLPGSFTGDTTIAPDGAGTSVAYGGDFTIRVPLVGKTLEQKAVPYMTSVLSSQQAKGIAWLADHTY